MKKKFFVPVCRASRHLTAGAICLYVLVLSTLTACGSGSSVTAPIPINASIMLTAAPNTAICGGAEVKISASLSGVSGPITWSLAPGTKGALKDIGAVGVTYVPDCTDQNVEATVIATVGGIVQRIQIALKPVLVATPLFDLPKVYTVTIFGEEGRIVGNPVASVSDRNGNLYVAYAPPVSEIMVISPDGAARPFAKVTDPVSIALGPTGLVYVLERAANTWAVRTISADGLATNTLSQTAPYDKSIGTQDGATGVATAASLTTIAVSSAGTVYVLEPYRLRAVASDGSISTVVAGVCEMSCEQFDVDGKSGVARFSSANGMVADSGGNIFVSQTTSIRKVTPDGTVSTLAGRLYTGPVDLPSAENIDGIGTEARLVNIGRVAIDSQNNIFALTSDRLRKITPAGVTTTVATNLPVYQSLFEPAKWLRAIDAGVPGTVRLITSERVYGVEAP